MSIPINQSILSWFVKMYTDTNGYIEMQFPHNQITVKFRLLLTDTLTDIADINITIFQLQQLLQSMTIVQPYDDNIETRFFQRLRFSTGDMFSNGSLIFFWESVYINTSIRLENNALLKDDVSALMETFVKARDHLKFRSGLDWNNLDPIPLPHPT